MTTQKNQDLSFELELMNAESSDEEYINPNAEEIFNKPNPINEQKSQSEVQNPMPVIDKRKQLTSKQKLKIALDRKRSKRHPKEKVRKMNFNVIQRTENMKTFLSKKECIDAKKYMTTPDFKQYMKNKFPKLSSEYSKIFDMTLSGDMDLHMLKFLCYQQNNLSRGKDKYDTDVSVGKVIFDKFSKNINI